MNIDLPYTTVKECIDGGIARPLNVSGLGDNDRTIPTVAKCADENCGINAAAAWIFNSVTFVFEKGRLFTRPVTLWFPLCPRHAPLQDTPKEIKADAAE